MRKATKGILPEEVLRQPRVALGPPIDTWLVKILKEMVDDLLSESHIRSRGYFDSKDRGAPQGKTELFYADLSIADPGAVASRVRGQPPVQRAN